jgi:phosphomannomutase
MKLAAGAGRPIRFGTSGWRGVLAEDFTFERARAAVTGVARWLREASATRPVLVAHDRRFLGERFARLAAEVLQAEGIRPILVQGSVATPVVSHGIVRTHAAGALIFTASHNPPAYQGLKVLGRSGGSLLSEATRRIEELAADALQEVHEGEQSPSLGNSAAPQATDLVGAYLGDLLRLIDRPALRRAGLSVHYDALHGTGSGVLDVALRRCGVGVLTLHGDPDPTFGGFAPDPVPEHLQALARAVRAGSGLRIGLATDGDADRLAVVDSAGRCLSETRTLALLVDHLARTGRVRRGVALSVATGSLVERVASHHGLSVKRLPIGFKYLTEALLDGSADVAGEESGGFALGTFARDKDGILAGCLLAERVATMRRPLQVCVRELERVFGRSEWGRSSVPASEPAKDALASLIEAPPARLGREAVRGADTSCGLRIELADGFLMLRASGTEPVIRLYGEASDARRLALRLSAGARLLTAR